MERHAAEFGRGASVDVADERPGPRQTRRLLDSWKKSAKHTLPGRLLYDVVASAGWQRRCRST
jgi:hypothetical protein